MEQDRRERIRTRAVACIPLAIAAAAAAGLYGPVVVGLLRQWTTDADNSHGLLLVIAAALVARRRWTALRALTLEPANTGFAVIAVALLMFVVGSLTGDVFILRLSLPMAAAGCILALCGRHHARLAFAPFGLLLLAIPLPSIVVTHLTLPLQLVASRVAAELLNVSGIFVAREGNLLMLRDITLEVAEACSGMRSLVSLVGVAGVCAAMLSLSAGRAVLLMVAAVPIAVVGNGLRVAATGFLTTWIGEIAVRGFLHDLTGFIAFLAMCTGIVGVQLAMRSRGALTARRA